MIRTSAPAILLHLLVTHTESEGADGRPIKCRPISFGVPITGDSYLCRVDEGPERMIPEQAAAIEALALIGGHDAAHAVSEMIERTQVQGPGLQIALSAAARLGSTLSPDALRRLLRHAEPAIRADACRCARPLPELILFLIDLLDDLDRGVATSAACALGVMGRIEARTMLKNLLRDDPSEDVIDAISSI